MGLGSFSYTKNKEELREFGKSLLVNIDIGKSFKSLMVLGDGLAITGFLPK